MFLYPGINKGFWSDDWRHIDPNLITDCRQPELNSTSQIAECITDLGHNCTITKECWKLMTDPEASGYQLAYQPVYFKLAEGVST